MGSGIIKVPFLYFFLFPFLLFCFFFFFFRKIHESRTTKEKSFLFETRLAILLAEERVARGRIQFESQLSDNYHPIVWLDEFLLLLVYLLLLLLLFFTFFYFGRYPASRALTKQLSKKHPRQWLFSSILWFLETSKKSEFHLNEIAVELNVVSPGFLHRRNHLRGVCIIVTILHNLALILGHASLNL